MRLKRLVAALGFVLALGVAAPAQVTVPSLQSAVLPGVYFVATLPDPTQNKARYAFVSDLGGGSDMVLSDGTNWKHIRQGTVTNVPIAASVPVTPLSSPPIMQLTSSTPYVGSAMINIASGASLYPGIVYHIIIPSSVLSTVTGALGTVGVNISGANSAQALPLVGGTWEDVQWNGTALVELGRGTL